MRKLIQSLKGTRDFYPEEMATRQWLYHRLREVSESFGYQEYEGPFLESLELYAAKRGDELVKEQSYVFPDRGGDLIALRPELTPTLVRMIAQRQQQLVYPLRWWSWGPMWRYERPQKGRTREFFQWNADLLGVATPEGDAEMVAVIATFFQKIGLKPQDAVILVNNRRLLDAGLTALDIAPEKRPDVSRLLDRRDKMQPAEWDAYALQSGLSQAQVSGLKEMLENTGLWTKSEELQAFFAAVQALGVKEYVHYDPKIVRGLDYYTGTVFEGWATSKGIRRAILGGGRYDNLLADVGGESLPGVGFAMGDVVITLVLQELGLLPRGQGLAPETVLVTVFDGEHILDSLALATELRQAGLKVICYPEAARLPRQFKFADRRGMRVAVVVGPDELANGQVAVKNLRSGEQHSVPRAEAPGAIRKLIGEGDSS
jgi:histidyl-tRNA synthetase